MWVGVVLLCSLMTSAVFARQHHLPSFNDHCGRHPAQSCSVAADTTSLGSCCIEKKAGLFLFSQFWDVHAGYDDRWTPSNCDPQREYTNITEILVSRRAFKLLQEINNDWPNSAGKGKELYLLETTITQFFNTFHFL
ncbi:unnamed protein product [Absidia cylindrospora]